MNMKNVKKIYRQLKDDDDFENLTNTKIQKVEEKAPAKMDASEYRNETKANPEFVIDDIEGYVEIVDYKIKPQFKKFLNFNKQIYACTKLCENYPKSHFCKVKSVNDDGSPVYGKMSTNIIADALLKLYDIIYVNDQIYLYHDGVYITGHGKNNVAKIILEYEVRNVMGYEFSDYKFSNVLNIIQSYTIHHQEELNSLDDWYLINFKNGIYNIKTKELMPHTPELLTSVQMNCDYNPNADCPYIKQYLSDMVDPEYHKTLLQMLSRVLIPNKYNNEYLILVGQAGTGKTQILHPIRAILKSHFTAMGLSTLLDKYAISSLQNVRANICGDISTLPIKDASILKQITGGETIDSDVKFKDRVTFRPTCILIFSANKLPRIEGADTADMDRLIYVPYRNRIRGTDKQITNFDELITTPEELSGFVNLLLVYLEEYLQTKKIHRTLKDVELAEDYSCKASPESTFMDYCVRPVNENEGMSISRQQAYDIYCGWCTYVAVSPKIPRAFGNILGKKGVTGYNGRNMLKSTWDNVDISLPNDIIEFLIQKGHISKNKHAYYSGVTDLKQFEKEEIKQFDFSIDSDASIET